MIEVFFYQNINELLKNQKAEDNLSQHDLGFKLDRSLKGT